MFIILVPLWPLKALANTTGSALKNPLTQGMRLVRMRLLRERPQDILATTNHRRVHSSSDRPGVRGEGTQAMRLLPSCLV